SPVLQHSFVPLYSNVSRRNSNSDVDASALLLTGLPLIVVLIVKLITLPPCRLQLASFVEDLGGLALRRSHGDFPRRSAGRWSGSIPMPPRAPPLLLRRGLAEYPARVP